MTHGVESGPETHQDSAALTYLEGLLMHPVTTGTASTVTQRSEPAQNNEDNANRVTFQVANHSSPSPEKGSPLSTVSQHLKKARLLRPGAWSEVSSLKQSSSIVDVNGQIRESYRGGLDDSAQGETTLLASLLQSFSSRLQNVALSQHISQSHKPFDIECGVSTPVDKKIPQNYGTASGHLKSLMKRSKQHKHNTVPYSRQGTHNQGSDSPISSQLANSDSMPCTERLKAVATMVRTRSSPAPSPKPSVACSQLALLLSSEAHLQKYSREQALKAQISSRSASERLAAMATQTQDKRPPSMEYQTTTPDVLASFNAHNGTQSPQVTNCTKRSQSLTSSSSRPLKERRPFDRHNRPPQNCSSLLLLLLNNHNAQQPLTRNGHLEDNSSRLVPSQSSSRQSDSDYSNPENNLTKDSSDAESFSCSSPIDLSMKNRAHFQTSEHCSSLTHSVDKLTESLLNKWKPEPFMSRVHESSDLETSPNMKSQDKVTLMQLLLEQRNNEKVNTNSDNTVISCLTTESLRHITREDTTRTWSPLNRQAADLSSISPSYTFSSTHIHPCPSPLDLCKSKVQSSEKVAEPPFSASKLLQNLAQSGIKSSSPSPPPLQLHKLTNKRQSPDLALNKPQIPLNKLVCPTMRKDGGSSTLPLHNSEKSLSSSVQIENLPERRTVLQLLLGSEAQKERTNGYRDFKGISGEGEKPQGAALKCDHSNGLLLNSRIKVEPWEKSPPSENEGDGHQSRLSQYSPTAVAQDLIKSEPSPSETAVKFGLLSQLLKQQNTVYHSSPHTRFLSSSIKDEPSDFHSSVPKKRKLCIELAERLSNELCQPSGETDNDDVASETIEFQCRQLEKPKVEDLACSAWNRTPPPRETQGFNVLKQLLLSENSLKELSQPTGTQSPFIPTFGTNGNSTHSGFCQDLSNLPWYPYSMSAGPKPVPTLVDSGVWGKASPKVGPMLHTELKGPSEDIFTKEERSSPDSPPLTRSNPILYYMLQRGNGQLKPEDQATHCVTELHRDSEHRRNSPVSSQTRNYRESFSGSVEKW